MGTVSKEMKELVGEHEAILAYMKTMTRSAENLAAQPSCEKERLWNYRQTLYDFRDAIWFHLDVDERVFKTLLGEAYREDPTEEHEEIQRLVNDMICLAENTTIENYSQDELDRFCCHLGEAFKKICKLIELHIARENAIIERVQKALN